MNASDMPVIPAYRYHALICAGKNCGEGLAMVKTLRQRLQAAGLDQGDHAVRVNRAGCLGVCTNGPVMVVYPGGVWYAGLNDEALDAIIASHFQQDTVVDAYCFHQAERYICR